MKRTAFWGRRFVSIVLIAVIAMGCGLLAGVNIDTAYAAGKDKANAAGKDEELQAHAGITITARSITTM